jgi:hypothetical protein
MERGLALHLSSDATGSLRQKLELERSSVPSRSRLLQGVEQEGRHCEANSYQEDESETRVSLPVLLLDAKRLSGYLPADENQANIMVQSLRTALFGESGVSAYKEDRILDLFATKKARHGIASGKWLETFLEIPYPDYLRANLKTRLVWEELQDSHDIPVVDQILRHLASCHQPLLWKYDMKSEILRIVDQELAFRELQSWKRRRAAELEQLYMVRETIAHRAEMEQALEESLLKERDKAMVETMKERSGLTSFDLHSTVFSFPDADNQIMGFTADDDDHYFGKNEEESDGDEESWSQGRGDLRLALNERIHTEQLRKATMVENSVREECTTTALRVSMAKVSALKKKLEEVDLLLESIQDEEWAEARTNQKIQTLATLC